MASRVVVQVERVELQERGPAARRRRRFPDRRLRGAVLLGGGEEFPTPTAVATASASDSARRGAILRTVEDPCVAAAPPRAPATPWTPTARSLPCSIPVARARRPSPLPPGREIEHHLREEVRREGLRARAFDDVDGVHLFVLVVPAAMRSRK